MLRNVKLLAEMTEFNRKARMRVIASSSLIMELDRLSQDFLQETLHPPLPDGFTLNRFIYIEKTKPVYSLAVDTFLFNVDTLRYTKSSSFKTPLLGVRSLLNRVCDSISVRTEDEVLKVKRTTSDIQAIADYRHAYASALFEEFLWESIMEPLRIICDYDAFNDMDDDACRAYYGTCPLVTGDVLNGVVIEIISDLN